MGQKQETLVHGGISIICFLVSGQPEPVHSKEISSQVQPPTVQVQHFKYLYIFLLFFGYFILCLYIFLSYLCNNASRNTGEAF